VFLQGKSRIVFARQNYFIYFCNFFHK